MIAGRFYALHTIQSFIQPNNTFCIIYHIIMLQILFNPKIKEIYVTIWSDQIWLWLSFSMQNRGQWGCKMDLSMTCAYRANECAAGSLHLDSVKQVATSWVGWQEHWKCACNLRDITNTFFFLCYFTLECESSECLLFLFYMHMCV